MFSREAEDGPELKIPPATHQLSDISRPCFQGNVAGVKHLPRQMLSLAMTELHRRELFLTGAHRSSSVRKKPVGDSQ